MFNIGIKIISEWFQSALFGSRINTGSTSVLGPKTVFRYFTRIWKVRSKNLRIGWKFAQWCEISQIIAFYANFWFDFSDIQLGPSEFHRKKSHKKISCRALNFDRKLCFFTDKSRILLSSEDSSKVKTEYF